MIQYFTAGKINFSCQKIGSVFRVLGIQKSQTKFAFFCFSMHRISPPHPCMLVVTRKKKFPYMMIREKFSHIPP